MGTRLEDEQLLELEDPLLEVSSTFNRQENRNKLPILLENISCLVHLAVFGILGMLTRYSFQKLFGPSVFGVTSDETALYLDLPSNMVSLSLSLSLTSCYRQSASDGSFLMGWLGVVFRGDISRFSDFLAIGLSTGYLGSLTTFSGWNQKMLDLSVNGKWCVAAFECLIGMFLVAKSISFGIQTAEGFGWLLKQLRKEEGSQSERPCSSINYKWHLAVLVLLLLILGLLWGVNGALLNKWLNDGIRNTTNAQVWLACIVGPPGVWVRWFLARFNGQGLGRNGSMKWIPFGTLIANVSSASMMAGLALLKKVVKTERCEIIATGIQLGFLGCLSTVSTFIAEYHAMIQSERPWRAHVYAAITILLSFGLGTLIYSIPIVWLGFWKVCASLATTLVQYSTWRVGQGNMSFWHENRSNMGVLTETFVEVVPTDPISLKEAADINFNIQGLSDSMISRIRTWYDTRLQSDSDERLWSPSPDGLFSVKSAFSLLWIQAPACPLARHYWAKFLPKKMSVLFWRLLHNAIPVDVRTQDCAISLASGCCCSVHRDTESTDHLFLRGEIAAFLWDRLSPLFGIHRTNYTGLREFISAWFNIAPRKSQLGKLAILFSMAIIWEIWSERNHRRHDEPPVSSASILYRVLQWVRNINPLLRTNSPSPGRLHHILQVCRLSPTPVRRKPPLLLRWSRPPSGFCILNTDGASSTQGAAGGGVIRDDHGILMVAFHRSYGLGSNNLAETRALLDGLLLCQQLGITNFIVKVDSNLVAGWFNRKLAIPWHLSLWWQKIREVTDNLNINLRHTYRELNSPADCMSSLGLSSRSNRILTADFPARLVGWARLDRLGMPYVRFG
ncbi:CrcB-like protein [Macleaya cordata]|uniref:CrcB-like protein n=1 Tax=Macleaya cordata TaxID=56857 RepID=A0A200QMK5_MACCD|nr:CrcB-like protein [Macleaya cordata]